MPAFFPPIIFPIPYAYHPKDPTQKAHDTNAASVTPIPTSRLAPAPACKAAKTIYGYIGYEKVMEDSLKKIRRVPVSGQNAGIRAEAARLANVVPGHTKETIARYLRDHL